MRCSLASARTSGRVSICHGGEEDLAGCSRQLLPRPHCRGCGLHWRNGRWHRPPLLLSAGAGERRRGPVLQAFAAGACGKRRGRSPVQPCSSRPGAQQVGAESGAREIGRAPGRLVVLWTVLPAAVAAAVAASWAGGGPRCKQELVTALGAQRGDAPGFLAVGTSCAPRMLRARKGRR